MYTKIRNRVEGDEGFTLIELLVVILIIGILAAIAIPSFLNQREKGQDACAKSMARTMQTAMETYFLDNNMYDNADPADLSGIENQITETACTAAGDVSTGPAGAAAACAGDDPTAAGGYCVSATSAANSGGAAHRFTIHRSAAGAITRNCAPVNAGGCVAAGTW